MPCDDSPVYIGSTEAVNSPIITGGSRRSSGNKIVSSGSSSSSSSSNSSSGRSRSSHDISQGGAVGSARNHYGTVAMAPRPLHSTTTLSTSRSSSSSSSTVSSTVSSSFDRQPRNESTNSSSSLILILERAGPPTASDDNARSSVCKSSRYAQLEDEKNSDRDIVVSTITDDKSNDSSPTSCFTGRVAASSLENLAMKKSSRCRRRRSATSPRKIHRQRSISREVNENLSVERAKSVREIDDGFVATSTLTKNRDASVLSVMTNASRSAGKVRLQSSSSRGELEAEDRDVTIAPEVTLTPCATAAVKSQKSTISVASIRGTNIISATESPSNNDYPTIGGGSSLASVPVDNVAGNFAVNVRCNVPSASAPTLLNNHRHSGNNNNNNNNRKHNQVPCHPRASSASHSTSLHSSIVPLAVLSTSNSPADSSKNFRKTERNRTTITTRKSATAGTVKSASSFVACTVFAAAGKSTMPREDEPVAVFARIDSSSSLKSSSFTAGRMMRINRGRTSIHASLGQLPITASFSTPSTLGGDGTSLENLDTEATSTGLESITVDPVSVPMNLCSSNSPVDPTAMIAHAVTPASLDRVCSSNGASTMSSTSSKTPTVSLPSNGTATNVAGPFRNSLVASGINNNNKSNSANNNGRCNHSSGTCTGNCTGATTNSHTSSTLPRTPSIVAGVASTSSWANNSVEQETDYVVDPVQGNAYHKGQFLGKGGFARVYLMTDVANGNQYACKIIPKNRMQKIHIQKIAREIMIHKELNHVNVVQMHHYFEDNINVYMLLEPCPRKSLMHVLKYRGKVTEPEARYYMKQMVTGVAYIHSQKVVHRDLKPGNMFLSDGMIVKIGDFGLATRPDGQRRRVTICGTPNYIAPEVLYKQAYSYEADVWALGCILYALLAGQPPFDTATLKETYARICNNRYKKLDDSLVSRSGQDLIRWLLQPIPELRPSLERVKEHAYLTMEYVPTKLAHTCCYRMPPPHSIAPEQTQLAVPQQLGLSCTSIISRGLVAVENIDRNKRDIAAGAIIQKNINHMTGGAVSQLQLEALKNNKKKPKVGNWLFRKLPKLPRFRQRLSRLLCPEQKKPDSLMMHRALEACLAEIRCTRALENPMLVDRIAPLFVTKWIDYSNKYGLGFQLSDRSVGVLFNDSTKMSYTHDRRRVEYATTDDDVTRYRRELDVPSCMEEKLELLRHFTHYMDNFLTNGGEVREQRSTKLARTNSASVPRMRRWLRTDKAIVMELTVPLLQVNFFVDHSKIVVSEGTRGRGYLVTYIDASRQASSYWLNDLRDIGCTAELYERLHYVCKVIAELENEAIFDPPAVTLQQHRKTFKT